MRWEELKRTREPFFNLWKDVSKYVSPYSGRFEVRDHDKTRDTRFILDSEASYDLSILSSGMMSGASNPARPWFKIAPSDLSLIDNYDVITYCDEVQKALLRVFANSNTYNTLHSIYRELALFGIAADLIYEDFDTGIKHHLLTAGEYCIATNEKGDVDTLYRNFELTTIQAVKAFGYDKLPNEIKQAYEHGDLGVYWEFLHIIEPRIDRDLKSIENQNFEWTSIYMYIGGNPTILREGGFDYFPCVVPRWDVLGVDGYGSSPSITALPDIKQLQQETLRKAELIDHYTKPPLQAPNNARQNPISFKAGAVNYVQNTGSDGSIKPISNGVGDLNALRQDIADIKMSIKQQYFVNLFQMVGTTAGDRRTTVEIYALQQEQMLTLGAVVERNQNELLGRLVEITYKRLSDANALPQMPEVLDGQPLNIEFTSVLAQSQKSVDINSVDRLFSALSMAGQVVPEIFDRIDADGYVDEYRDRLGVAPKILKSRQEAEKIREARAQAQEQQAQQAQQAQQVQLQEQQATAQKTGAEAGLAMQQLDNVGGGAII